MKITKTADGLMVRIPDDVATALQLKEGDEVDLKPVITMPIVRSAEDRAHLMAEFDRLARPLPPGYKFDREEANTR